MAEKNRSAKDVGSESPPSESAKEQRMSGASGGPQASGSGSSERQPPQTSGRRDPAHEHDGTVRRSFDPGQDPNRQGDGDPGPEQIRNSDAMQGAAGGAGGGLGLGGRNEETAQSGEPQGGHTGSGQQAPGDREPQQPG
jgi:hypothetical protein